MSADDQPELDPVRADAIRRAYVRPIDQDTARRQLSAIVAAAAAGEQPAARRPRQRRRAWQAALVAGAATVLAPAGLAVAGVSLPKALEQPYRTVGITLPNQAHHAPPATRPLPPRSPTKTRAPDASGEPRRSQDQRPRRPRGGHTDPQRAKRREKPGNSAGARRKSRGHSVSPPQRHSGGARKKPKPTPSRSRSRPRTQSAEASQHPSTPAGRGTSGRLPGDR